MPTDAWCTPGTPAPPPSGAELFNSLCETGWQPYLLTGLFVDWLSRHFAEPGNAGAPSLRNVVWRPDERTDILIEEESSWTGTLTEKRPAVVVKRNEYRSVKLVMRDLSGGDERLGTQDRVKFWVGSHTLFCIDRNGPGAEILAQEVQREVGQFAPEVRRLLGLHALDVMTVGAPSVVEEATEGRSVAVTVAVTYEETWRLAPEALTMGNLSLSRICRCSN
jgi:hypothetical protein